VPNRTADVQPARQRCRVLTPYSPLPLRVHANSQLSPPVSLHRPNGQRFHLVRLPPYPRNAQLKRKQHSISIVGRARQRVRSSHLIGSASAHHHSALAKIPALGPSHSRSRLATRQDLFPRTPASVSLAPKLQRLIVGHSLCALLRKACRFCRKIRRPFLASLPTACTIRNRFPVHFAHSSH